MYRFILPLVEIGLLVYCLIDCVQTDSTRVRNLPKLVWLLLIVVLPLVGGIAWLVAGRPQRSASGGGLWPAPRSGPDGGRPPRGPDDDPDFLRQIRQVDEEHERTLRQWEDDLRRREQQLRDEEGTPDDGPQDDPPAGTAPR